MTPLRLLARADQGRGVTVLERLRGDSDRPVVDPGLAGGLRDWLEVGLAERVGTLPDADGPVRVTKERLNQVLVCEAHFVASTRVRREVTPDLARGSLVDALFRQWVTVGALEDPFLDALAALEVAGGQEDVVAFLAGLPAAERRRLAADVTRHAACIEAGWPAVHHAWLPRTQERIDVPLAGGRVILSGVVDLILGGPAEYRASVCLVEVKSGARRVEHRSDLLYYALLETLRSGAPPFRAATYYSATGDVDDEDVSESVLTGVLERVLEGTVRLCRLSCGATPTSTPNPLCAWCIGLPSCPAGQRRAGTATPRQGRQDPGSDPLLAGPGEARREAAP